MTEARFTAIRPLVDVDVVEAVQYPALRRGRPVYLSGVACPGLEGLELAGADVGLLLQPNNGTRAAAGRYRVWAADNGCFAEAQGKPWSAERWFAWLSTLPRPELDWSSTSSARARYGAGLDARGCLFATAPDVLGDAAATWTRSVPWLDRIRSLGLPAALVAQDGLEDLEEPWEQADRWDCLFVGGSTEWKLSSSARDAVARAQELGKWVHVGRVNSNKRLRIAASWDADTVDGTFLGFGPTKNTPRLAAWLDELITKPVPPAPATPERLALAAA